MVPLVERQRHGKFTPEVLGHTSERTRGCARLDHGTTNKPTKETAEPSASPQSQTPRATDPRHGDTTHESRATAERHDDLSRSPRLIPTVA